MKTKRKRRLKGERASDSHYDRRKKETLLVHGWDYWDTAAPAAPAVEEDNPTWDDVKEVWEYLWRDERIILRLVREGKTPTDVAEIMRLPDRFEARAEIKRAVKVVAFYAKWAGAIRRLCGLTGVFTAEHKRVAVLYTRRRKNPGGIARRTGYKPSTVSGLVSKEIPRKLRDAGEAEVADMVSASLKFESLRRRTDRRKNMPQAWREELKKYLIANLGKLWYEWGGQSLERHEVDCSGLVIVVLQRFGVLPAGFKDTTALGLSAHFRTGTDDPRPGDLVFYGQDKRSVSHVMFYVGNVDGHEDCVVGMCGGRRNMKAPWARKVGASMWVRSMRYRRDFLFCRKVR